MNINEFITNFQGELDNPATKILPTTDFRNEDFWDSLTSMAVEAMIEGKYGIEMEEDAIKNFESLQELYNYIELRKRKNELH